MLLLKHPPLHPRVGQRLGSGQPRFRIHLNSQNNQATTSHSAVNQKHFNSVLDLKLAEVTTE